MSLFLVLLLALLGPAAASALEHFPRQSLPVSFQAPGINSNPVGIYSSAGAVSSLIASSTEFNGGQVSRESLTSVSVPVPRPPAPGPPVLQRRSLMDLSRKIFGGTYVTLHVGDMPPNHPLVKYPAPLRQNPAHTTAATMRDQMTQALESSPNFNYNRNMHHAHQKNNGEGSHYSPPRPPPNSLFKRFKLKPRPHSQFKQRPIPMPVPFSFDSTEHNPTAMSELRPFQPSDPDTQIQASTSPTYNHNRHYLGTPGPHVDPSANSFNQNTTNHHPIQLSQQYEAPAASNNHRRHALPPPGPSPQNSLLLNITFEGGPGRGTHYNKGHFNTNQMLRRKRLNMQQKFHIPPPFPSIKQNYSLVNSYGASDELSNLRRVARKENLNDDGSKTMYIFSSSESVEVKKPGSGSLENISAIKRSGQEDREEETTSASAGTLKKPLFQKLRQLGPTYRRPTATTTATTTTTTATTSTTASMPSRKREVPMMEMSPMETTLLSTDWSRRSRSSEYYKRKANVLTASPP